MIFLYFGIPLAILVIAVIRAGKGKRSVIMLTIMVAIQVLFNSAAILNSMANGDDKSLNVGISMTLAQIVTYIAAIFITCKQANKVKKNLAIGYTQRLQGDEGSKHDDTKANCRNNRYKKTTVLKIRARPRRYTDRYSISACKDVWSKHRLFAWKNERKTANK